MGWWLARTLGAVLVLGGVMLVGAVSGAALGSTLIGMVVAGALGVVALVVRDSLRGQSLMHWLRGPQTSQAAAPRALAGGGAL